MIQRFEQKAEVATQNSSNCLHWLSEVGFRVHHPPRIVCSLYFDTQFMEMYRDTQEGLLPRKKLRLRTYGTRQFMNSGSTYFLEVKLSEAYSRSKTIISDVDHEQIMRCGYYLEQYGYCYPRVFISYLREYYVCGQVRATFDTEIAYERFGIYSRFVDESSVMEFKFPLGCQDDVLDLLSEFPRSRFSKYERAVDSFSSGSFLS